MIIGEDGGVVRIFKNCLRAFVFKPGPLESELPETLFVSSSSKTGIGRDEGSGEFKNALEQKCGSEDSPPETDFFADFGLLFPLGLPGCLPLLGVTEVDGVVFICALQ